jgi:hypothetical protein
MVSPQFQTIFSLKNSHIWFSIPIPKLSLGSIPVPHSSSYPIPGLEIRPDSSSVFTNWIQTSSSNWPKQLISQDWFTQKPQDAALKPASL